MAIRMRLPNDAHFLADLAVSVPVRRGLQGFVQIENLFDRRQRRRQQRLHRAVSRQTAYRDVLRAAKNRKALKRGSRPAHAADAAPIAVGLAAFPHGSILCVGNFQA